MDGPERPLTRAGVRAWARAQAHGGATGAEVSPVEHDGLADDPVSGGFAFRAGRVVHVALHDGSHGSHLDPGDDAGRRALLDRVLDRARRRNRLLALDDLDAPQRAVLAALRAGVRRVAALDPGSRPGVGPAELSGAEWLLMQVRAAHPRRSPGEADAMATFARNDLLLAAPETGRVHPCGVCWGLAPWTPRYRRAVCADCEAGARCVHDRRVVGHDLGGDFRAHHRAQHAGSGEDDGDEIALCVETTATGSVRVAGWPATMHEARFGGTLVQLDPAPMPDVRDPMALGAAVRDAVRLLAEVTGMPAPTPPAWATTPAGDDPDTGAHLRQVVEHLTDELARGWCDEQAGDPDASTEASTDPDAVRAGLRTLVDPGWDTAD